MQNHSENFEKIWFFRSLDPFVATPLKERFVVFLKWPLIGYFKLGQVILGQVVAPQYQAISPAGARNSKKATVKNTNYRPLRSVATKRAIPDLSRHTYKQADILLLLKSEAFL